ncbi:MAG: hypothetical protein Q7N50_04200 [Armatimonadota bacterium]|nr:hypothetical protein [Armatimonadota bacterium]
MPLIALVAALPFIPLAYFTTHSPLFCASCHKKTHEAQLWRESHVHPTSVGCIDCHAVSRGLIHRSFSAKPGRVNANCIRCHSLEKVRRIGKPGYAFKKNPNRIIIPHEVHIKATGAGCTLCHYNLAHGRRDQETNRPTMESCFTCHQSDRTNCAKCHPAGTVEPPKMVEISQHDCGSCHSDFLNKALSFQGLAYQHRKHVENGVLCRNCHSTSGKHGELVVTKAECEECHQRSKPESHTAEWLKVHGGSAIAGEQRCENCHKQKFCYACHNIDMPHPAGWNKSHASNGVGATGVCAQCHNRTFCRECHSEKSKSPHGSGWSRSHGLTAMKSSQTCANCHKSNFCSNCHGLQIPHPAKWVMTHGKQATADASRCANCHQSGKPNSCENCHKSRRPSWHTDSFAKKHSEDAKRNPSLCPLCHGKNGCMNCHETPMPHAKDWMGTHGSKGASFKEGAFCFNCHGREKCAMCHGDGVRS